MEFFTREWYGLCQNSGWHLLLKVKPQAAERSEKYYQALLRGKLGAAVRLEKAVCALTGEPFDREAFKAGWLRDHRAQAERLGRVLPPEILRQVADPRVLALDVSTQAVKDALTAWCEDNWRRAEGVREDYQTWAEEVRPLVGPEIQDGFSFHDSTVTAVEREGDRLTLFLEPGGYSQVERVDFLGARVLEEDEGLAGAVWLYGEVHPAPGGNEYHSLLWRADRTLCLTVFAGELRLREKEGP